MRLHKYIRKKFIYNMPRYVYTVKNSTLFKKVQYTVEKVVHR
jgi:hypothetical protein